jgi:hypothetical protein
MVRFEEKGMVITIPHADRETHRNYLDAIIQVMKMKDSMNGETSNIDYWVLDLLQNMVSVDSSD